MEAFMEELLQSFNDEASEIFDELDSSLLSLEENPNDSEIINNIFRYVHTLKGSSNMMGFTNTGSLSHAMEDLLSLIRSGKKDLNDNTISLFFETVDCLKVTINSELNGLEPPEYREDIINELKEEGKLRSDDLSGSYDSSDKQSKSGKIKQDNDKSKNNGKKDGDTLRIKWDKLVSLMSYVEELFVGRARLTQATGEISTSYQVDDIISELEDITHTMNKLIARIQMLVMEIRRVPLQDELSRFNRLLRDLSREYNKDVKLKLECRNTEIDRELSEIMSEVIGATIVSIVEKSIEDKEEREALDKDPVSNIECRGRYVGSDVVIDILDDGRGLTIDEITDDKQVWEKINKIRGKFEVIPDVEKPQTTYRFSVPANSSIIKVLLVRVEDEEFAIPLSSVNEIVTLNENKTKRIQGRWVLPHMDRVIPIHSINEISDRYISDSSEDGMSPLGVVLHDICENAIIGVDEVIGEDEVLLKELEEEALNSEFIQGVTVLGNGRIIVVLEPASFL